jgi:geranylgeranyl diphosphate synthase type II
VSLDQYLQQRRAAVEAALAHVLPTGTPARLREACLYSLLAGGKRLRPVMAIAACEAVGGTAEAAMPIACALEMIHTYSLIHDDLPAMDNDDFRRGRPTNHKVYGDGMAVLAGDALLTDAFAVAARVGGERAGRCVAELARAAGAGGMVGGQVLDVLATGRKLSEAELVEIHRKKTGALFVAAVVGGGIVGGANEETLGALRQYADAAGLGFQIIDDVLDVTQDLATLGKPPGSDQAAGKTTYVDMLGVEGARARARGCLGDALAALQTLGAAADPLREIARYLIDRDR